MRRNSRLTDSSQFDRVYRQGIVYRGRLFSVHAFANQLDTPRLGLSVSKKVGNAVVRNSVRRKIREIFHLSIEELPANLDVVVSARPLAAQASFQELEAEFAKFLSRLQQKEVLRGSKTSGAWR